MSGSASPAIPRSLQAGYAIWLAAWVPLQAVAYGVPSFLWFCALANVLVGVALWREDARLLSMQAVSVLLLQALYSVDLAARLVTGRPLSGATDYVFADGMPLGIRLLSLHHVAVPVVILFGLTRLGYDPAAFRRQSVLGWTVLLASLAAGPRANVNGVWSPPLGRLGVPWPIYFLLLCAALPLVLYWPTHGVLQKLFGVRSLGFTSTIRRPRPASEARS